MMCQSCGKLKATVHVTEIDDEKQKRGEQMAQRL